MAVLATILLSGCATTQSVMSRGAGGRSETCPGCSAESSTTGATPAASVVGAAATCAIGLQTEGRSPAEARRDASDAAACRSVARRCRWVIGNSRSRDRDETTPGSHVDRPPGSCPPAQLGPVLDLALDLQRAGRPGDPLCAHLTTAARFDAQRVARAESVTCAAAAIRFAGEPHGQAVRELSRPLLGIVLLSQAPGPPHWFGYISLGRRGWRPGSTTMSPMTTQVVMSPNGVWQISQIDYEF